MKKTAFNKDWTCNQIPVTLPHDAMLHEGRKADSTGGSALGYYQGGKYLYEKEFDRPKEEQVKLLFEGAYRKAKVRINGKEAGGCAYGYTEFIVDATPYLQDGRNVIQVETDNSQTPNSRFYTGSGLYRPVWLLTAGDSYIIENGVRVTTTAIQEPDKPADTTATLQVEIDALVDSSAHQNTKKKVEIISGDEVVAVQVTEEAALTMVVEHVILWNDEHPNLYRCRVTLLNQEEILDVAETTFGIRQITWDGKGLYVNGVNTLLRGGCIHHDNGILGACSYREAEFRKIKLLKDNGFNAIRSAHNPCSRAVLDACDYYGIYVMDESWDMWFQRKTKFDYALEFKDNWKIDLEAMVAKDYNHPSVLFYSIGNEVSEPAIEEGLSLAQEMTDYVHELDATRAVTGGYNLMLMQQRAKKGSVQFSEEDPKTEPMNSSLMFNKMAAIIGTGMNNSSGTPEVDQMITPLMDIMDVSGYNYASGRYEKDLQLHPQRLIIGTETFPQDITKNWKMVEQQPNLAGDFMWTAIDYLGEAGIGAWSYTKDGMSFTKPYPWVLGDVGALDLLGNPTGEIYMANAAWHQLSAPKMTVQPANHPGVKVAKNTWRGTNGIPSWSWKNCDGNKTVVEVYTEEPVVVLCLNGKKIGKKKTENNIASFKVKYKPGTLQAVTLNQNKQETGRCELISAQETQIQIQPEKHQVMPEEIVYVPIALADSRGVVESNDDKKLTVTVTGGKLLGFGSANPRTEEDFLAGSYTTYYGRALAIVRAGSEGCLTITVEDAMGRKCMKEIGVINE